MHVRRVPGWTAAVPALMSDKLRVWKHGPEGQKGSDQEIQYRCTNYGNVRALYNRLINSYVRGLREKP